MHTVTTIGLDIAKSVFQVHGIDAQCLVGIEACASSHHWSRELQALGHTVTPDAGGVREALRQAKEDLAAQFHVLENGPAGNVGEEYMRGAASVAAWHLAEARRTLGATEKLRVILDAEMLLEWLLKQPGNLEPRRILQFGPAPLRNRNRRDQAIDLLIEKHSAREQCSAGGGALIINRKLNGMARWASSTGGSDRRHQLLRKRGLLHPLELL
jgi:hypothetical protein